MRTEGTANFGSLTAVGNPKAGSIGPSLKSSEYHSVIASEKVKTAPTDE